MISCAPPEANQLVAERLANYLDCQAQSLGANGFASLAGGWFGPALLWGCLTIYVALIGYRLIFGEPFGPREAVLAALRAGVVIAFATSWSAYDAVVYRVVSDGPGELASQLISGETGATTLSEAAQRLDADYSTLQIAQGSPSPASARAPINASASVNLPPPQVVTPTTNPADPATDHAWFLLVITIVGGLGALKLVGGLLLGTGPIFITLGLFDVTLGVLVGWGRALLGLFVALTGGMCLMGLELGFIESQLPGATQGFSGLAPLAGPTLMTTAVLFAISMTLMLIVAFAIGCSLRVRAPLMLLAQQPVGSHEVVRRDVASISTLDTFALQTAGRAQTVADAVRRIGERESAMDSAWASPTRIAALQSFRGGAAGRGSAVGPVSVGHASAESRRRLTRARTPSAQRRDQI